MGARVGLFTFVNIRKNDVGHADVCKLKGRMVSAS